MGTKKASKKLRKSTKLSPVKPLTRGGSPATRNH